MAHFDEHCQDCERVLGEPCEDVNRWIDSNFSHFGPRHRFVMHHQEGAAKAGELFGERGRKAALIHILKDCGHIPRAEQYHNGEVDVLGMPEDEPFGGHWDPQQFTAKAREICGISNEVKDVGI